MGASQPDSPKSPFHSVLLPGRRKYTQCPRAKIGAVQMGLQSDAAGVHFMNERRLFWACFVSLIATAFGFFTRFAVLNEWGRVFNLDDVQKGEIGGVGVWPFAISIILFSLVIDKIGYGTAMAFAFISHITYGILVIC